MWDPVNGQRRLFSLALAAGLLTGATSRAVPEVRWSTVDGGGITFARGGRYSVGGTIGQPDAGTLSQGTRVVTGGFWAGAPVGARYALDGRVDYSGAQPGRLLIEVHSRADFQGQPVRAVLLDRGRGWAFRIANLPAGVYYLRAFVDADADGVLDALEARVPAGGMIVSLVQDATFPDLILHDVDTDEDGLPDWWEVAHFAENYPNQDAESDTDGDGYSNLHEYEHGMDPSTPELVLLPGWSLISIRDLSADDTVETLLGDAITGVVWVWEDGRYRAVGELHPWRGHWVYRQADTVAVVPLPVASRAEPAEDGRAGGMLRLVYGWNLISIGPPPADHSVGAILGQHVRGPVWIWEDGAYVAADTLLPLRGHWVYCPSLTGAEVEVGTR